MTNRFLFLCVIILFLTKVVAINFTVFNLFGDEAQYWLWAKNLNFGYFSKPPFLAWALGFYTGVFGDDFIVLKMMPSIVYFITALALYDLCKNLGLNKNNALSCSLLFLFIPAVSFSSFILSTDIFLLLFWTLSLSILIRIRKYPKKINFVLLGIMLGLAFLSKYAAIYFLICLLLYIVFDKEFRVVVSKNYFGILLSFLCIFIIILPNIYWNFNNGWVTFQHTSDNANFRSIEINLYRGFEFLVIQALMLGPLIILGVMVNYRKFKLEGNQKFLLIFSVPILLLVFFEAIIVRANANWAAPALISLFLFFYINIIKSKTVFYKLNMFFNFSFCLVFFILVGISYPAEIFKRISGLKNFAENIYSTGKNINVLDFVVSDRLMFASLSYELRGKNVLIHMPHKKNDKITNHFKITSPLKKEMNKNFILIGSPNDIVYLVNSHIINKKKQLEEKFTNKKINIYEVIFN